MAGMRNKLTHDYVGVNLRRVFDTVQDDLPVLRSTITRVLADVEGNSNA
jgi:uncharacterized protein with HEPN domain